MLGVSLGVGILGTIVMSSVRVDDGVSAVSSDQLDALAASLRIDGVLSFFIVMLGFVGLTAIMRRNQVRFSEIHSA